MKKSSDRDRKKASFFKEQKVRKVGKDGRHKPKRKLDLDLDDED